MKTKNALGQFWQYKNSPARGITWSAEIRIGNALLCVYGQKLARSAILLANKYAKRLGWKLVEPWTRWMRAEKTKGPNRRRGLIKPIKKKYRERWQDRVHREMGI